MKNLWLVHYSARAFYHTIYYYCAVKLLPTYLRLMYIDGIKDDIRLIVSLMPTHLIAPHQDWSVFGVYRWTHHRIIQRALTDSYCDSQQVRWNDSRTETDVFLALKLTRYRLFTFFFFFHSSDSFNLVLNAKHGATYVRCQYG